MSGLSVGVEGEARALDARVDDILAAHGGDARAAIEVLLLVNDARARSISWGYVRGLLPGRRPADGADGRFVHPAVENLAPPRAADGAPAPDLP